jgi:hypothetical protein
VEMSMIYPTMDNETPVNMKTPRCLYLSDRYVAINTVKKAAIFGGTVNKFAYTFVYPSAEIIVGKNNENE